MLPVLLLNVPLAPLLGAAKVTEGFGTRLLSGVRTVTNIGLARAVLTAALWPEPEASVVAAHAPGYLGEAKGGGGGEAAGGGRARLVPARGVGVDRRGALAAAVVDPADDPPSVAETAAGPAAR